MTETNPTAESETGSKLVDVQILETVAVAAKLRLELLRAYEQRADGVATTTLALVARRAVLEWDPAGEPPPKRTKRPKGSAPEIPTRPFRFHVPPDLYEGQKDAIRAAGGSVAGVVQAALTKFAYTGNY